ncbi:MAG: autotransporter-associated beta strand repeat-containing protein [Undibacterium sp.]|nr:autotransporter-associated beta strand repeat-containing protein [Opitutaceae bacterium]
MSWTAANIRGLSGATLALNVGGTGEFTTGNVTALLTNLPTINNNGLKSGSTLGFDTTNASGGTFTLANTIANSTGTGGGALGVIKLGAGTLVLSGANTYTGTTTISAGTLLVNGSLAAGSAVSVASGATFGGSGSVNGTTTVASGGTLAPGTSPGLLTFGGNLTLNSGSFSTFEIHGTTRGTTYDAVDVAGLTTYGGTLTFNFGSSLADGATLNLFGLTGGSAGALN